MIQVTRLNDTKIYINPILIEMMEETPDTVIVFNSGHKMVVKEKTGEIDEKFADFISSAVRKGMNN